MNNNGIAVLVGILLIVVGALNQLSDSFRAVVSISLVVIGIVIIVFGIATDKIEEW